jgi:hypothetical protein
MSEKILLCKKCSIALHSGAKVCPACGKRQGWSWPVKLFLGFFALVFLAVLAGPPGRTSNSTSNSSSPPRTLAPRDDVRANLTLDTKFKLGVLDNIWMANFTVRNGSTYSIKDIEITCEYAGKSGTRIDRNVRRVYEKFPAGTTRKVPNFNMGFVHTQANAGGCAVTDFVLD